MTGLLLFMHFSVLFLNAWYISVAPWIDTKLYWASLILFIGTFSVFAVYVICENSKSGAKFFSYILCILRLSHIQTTFRDDRRRIFFYNAISLLVLQDFPQFALQLFNSMFIGRTLKYIMIISPLISFISCIISLHAVLFDQLVNSWTKDTGWVLNRLICTVAIFILPCLIGLGIILY
jgi:hypothetical protein